jgi:HK97 family phage prohead protease
MAEWDTSYVNDLPDSAFLTILGGGHKDADGKTMPRSLRYFPVRNAAGDVDLPHVRNALARIPQASSLSAAQREAAMAKAKSLAKTTTVSGEQGEYSGSAGSGRSRTAPEALSVAPEGLQLRSYTFPVQYRSDGSGRTLMGRAVPYGEVAEVGGLRERFVAGAFARQIQSGNAGRIKIFESHHARLEGSPPIGKTADLEERYDGLHGAWPLYSTSRADDALELVRSGEVTGLSVGFKPLEGGSVKGRDGVIERRAAHLDHVVLTHEPIYENAGVLSVRAQASGPRLEDLRADLDARRL